VGSTPVAKYIYTTAAAQGKRVQALGGAKNHLIVMADADMEKTVEAIIGSAFGAAGERCLAGSVLVAVGEIADALVERVVTAASALTVGPGSEGCDLTPLIRDSHRARVLEYIEIGLAENGGDPSQEGCFFEVDDVENGELDFYVGRINQRSVTVVIEGIAFAGFVHRSLRRLCFGSGHQSCSFKMPAHWEPVEM
jgi:acyl-CoA reductase-like NAD-dependent aldehyde dehydrogenase